MTKVYEPLRRTYRSRSLGLVRGRLHSAHHARHETAIWGRFAGPDKLVYLIGHGEGVPRLGRSFGNWNQPVLFTLHSFSFFHEPQTKQGHLLLNLLKAISYLGFMARTWMWMQP